MIPAGTTATIGARHFHEQLAHLKQRLLDMSDLATSLLDAAVDALVRRDVAMAESVLANDKAIDALELEVEDQAIALNVESLEMWRRLGNPRAISLALQRAGIIVLRRNYTPDDDPADVELSFREVMRVPVPPGSSVKPAS